MPCVYMVMIVVLVIVGSKLGRPQKFYGKSWTREKLTFQVRLPVTPGIMVNVKGIPDSVGLFWFLQIFPRS